MNRPLSFEAFKRRAQAREAARRREARNPGFQVPWPAAGKVITFAGPDGRNEYLEAYYDTPGRYSGD